MPKSNHNPKRRISVTCSGCKKNIQITPAGLLQSAAQSLTACHDAGLDLKIRHGVLSCDEGLILMLDDGKFIARTRFYTSFSEPGDIED